MLYQERYVYLTDRDDHVVLKYTLDGKPLRLIGDRGKPSDTGRVLRAAGPFNKPTEMVPGPNGDLYVTDGYRNARVHRFSPDGHLISSWGEPAILPPVLTKTIRKASRCFSAARSSINRPTLIFPSPAQRLPSKTETAITLRPSSRTSP